MCVCVCAVSYTHLDVYKRQSWSRLLNTGMRSVNLCSLIQKTTTLPRHFPKEQRHVQGLSLIHIQMCIRDSLCIARNKYISACYKKAYSFNKFMILEIIGLMDFNHNIEKATSSNCFFFRNFTTVLCQFSCYLHVTSDHKQSITHKSLRFDWLFKVILTFRRYITTHLLLTIKLKKLRIKHEITQKCCFCISTNCISL